MEKARTYRGLKCKKSSFLEIRSLAVREDLRDISRNTRGIRDPADCFVLRATRRTWSGRSRYAKSLKGAPTNLSLADHGKKSDMPPTGQLPSEQQATSGMFSSSVPPPRTDKNFNQSNSQIPPLPNFGHSLPQHDIPAPIPPLQQPINRQRRSGPRNVIPYVDNLGGIPRRHDRGPVRDVESHFRPSIAYNASQLLFHNNMEEEPYLHMSAYDAMCNTIGGQGFTPDDVKLVLFQFTLEDKAQQWFHSLPSAYIYTWGDMQQQFID
ncbi:hypothetical protein L1987_77982 [Smallanthus sonchifolius]|uniref:Uncharacterized protein n=1 Tax=Smallanthus sonchifolius TaxID=185202 RepID=A0ACB8ZCH0_9ASTR|nr:hypothetical protein L1987_77982 [Smallanthus sonchifolius]